MHSQQEDFPEATLDTALTTVERREKGSAAPALAVLRPRPRANRPDRVSAITSRTMSNTRSPTLLPIQTISQQITLIIIIK